jgi:hypothetical protein
MKENWPEDSWFQPLEHDLVFYIVTRKDEDTELGDIFYPTTLRDLMLQAKGGLHTDDVVAVFLNEAEARTFAEQYMGSPMREKIGEIDPQETKEEVLRQLLGEDDIPDLDEETMDLLIQRLTGIDTIEESARTIISVLRDLKADEKNILEALTVNLGVHLSEAKEMYEDHKLYG